MFAQTSHEYLITQIQFNLFQGLKAGPNYLETTFSHPVKEIIWVLTMDNLDQYNDWYNFTGLQENRSFEYWQSHLKYYILQEFNEPLLGYIKESFTTFVNNVKAQSVDKLTPEQTQTYFGDYYNIMESAQPVFNNNDRMEIQEHDFYQNLQIFKYHSGLPKNGIYVLSFALKPEEYQPTGSDERQLSSQSIRIPTGVLTTIPYEQFPEYHTSADDLNFISVDTINNMIELYLKILLTYESYDKYKMLIGGGEPFLSKYNLYRSIGTPGNSKHEIIRNWILHYCDGTKNIKDISKLLNLPEQDITEYILQFEKNQIIRKV